jgi:hypothetical protein
MAWPEELARVAVSRLALVWAAAQSFRPRLDAAHEARLALGGAILLAPTLHPWYVLWVLPIAAVQAAGGWLLFGALVPLQYSRASGRAVVDPPADLLPSLAWMIRDALLRFRR